MPKYPTAAEILADLPVPDPKEVFLVKHFFIGTHFDCKGLHKNGWVSTDLLKIGAWARYFLQEIGIPAYLELSVTGSDWFDHETRMINLVRPNIVIALHEIGHAKLGYSELDACRYSWSLVKAAVPAKFAVAKFEGHRLTL